VVGVPLEHLLGALHRTDGSSSVPHRICVVCTDSIDVEGAGLSRVSDGRQEFLTAHGAAAETLERLQVDAREGPCREALASYRPFLEPDLSSEAARARWPSFSDAAVEVGINAAFAFPLLTGGVAIGALDLYSRRRGGLVQDAYEDATLLADLAALAVDQRPDAGIEEVGARVEPVEPWAYPAVVHNASGMIAEQLGITVDDALLRIRAVGFVIGRDVGDIARDVLDRRVQIESWFDE